MKTKILIFLAMFFMAGNGIALAGDLVVVSVDDFMTKMCRPQYQAAKKIFLAKNEGVGKELVKKVRVQAWQNKVNKDSPGVVLGGIEKKHMYILVDSIYDNKWLSANDVLFECMIGKRGEVFPKYMYSELDRVVQHFSAGSENNKRKTSW